MMCNLNVCIHVRDSVTRRTFKIDIAALILVVIVLEIVRGSHGKMCLVVLAE